MRFIETTIFTEDVHRFLSENEYHDLQLTLMSRPERGTLIRGGGGLRKIRWGVRGRGKRGGLRIIYQWDGRSGTFFMLMVYAKSEQGDVTPAQRRLLTRLVKESWK